MTRAFPAPGLILAVAIAVLALGPNAASAQEPPVPSPSTLVEEVEVIGRLPGPAMWRVSTPTSQIWFFAVPGTGLPKGFHWDDRRVAKALEGARELVVPPQTKFGIGAIASVVIDPGHRLHQPPGHTVRDDLPPDLKARWVQAARAVGQDPSHYDHWRPALAAGFLQDDINKHNRDAQTDVGVQFGALLKKLHVKVRSPASYSGKDMLKSIADTPDAAAQACMGFMADWALSPLSEYTQAGEAWAKGDFGPALALSRRGSVCADAAPVLVDLRDRMAADWAKDLKADLGKPGKAVVVTDLETLTRKGGLLDQMKAEGLEVIGPAWQ